MLIVASNKVPLNKKAAVDDSIGGFVSLEGRVQGQQAKPKLGLDKSLMPPSILLLPAINAPSEEPSPWPERGSWSSACSQASSTTPSPEMNSIPAAAVPTFLNHLLAYVFSIDR